MGAEISLPFSSGFPGFRDSEPGPDSRKSSPTAARSGDPCHPALGPPHLQPRQVRQDPPPSFTADSRPDKNRTLLTVAHFLHFLQTGSSGTSEAVADFECFQAASSDPELSYSRISIFVQKNILHREKQVRLDGNFVARILITCRHLTNFLGECQKMKNNDAIWQNFF